MSKVKKVKKKITPMTPEQEREWQVRYHCHTIVHALEIAAKQYEVFEAMLDDTLSGPGDVRPRSSEVARLAAFFEKEFPVITDDEDFL